MRYWGWGLNLNPQSDSKKHVQPTGDHLVKYLTLLTKKLKPRQGCDLLKVTGLQRRGCQWGPVLLGYKANPLCTTPHGPSGLPLQRSILK